MHLIKGKNDLYTWCGACVDRLTGSFEIKPFCDKLTHNIDKVDCPECLEAFKNPSIHPMRIFHRRDDALKCGGHNYYIYAGYGALYHRDYETLDTAENEHELRQKLKYYDSIAEVVNNGQIY